MQHNSEKRCKKCGETKPAGSFRLNSRMRDGRLNVCDICRRAAARLWNKQHAEVIYTANKKWRAANRKTCIALSRAWAKKYPAKVSARVTAREAAKLQATPGWANKNYIEDTYANAAIRTKRDGTPWHVDHSVPLKSKLVCGLHWEENLQVMPRKDNISKGNRHWPDMWEPEILRG